MRLRSLCLGVGVAVLLTSCSSDSKGTDLSLGTLPPTTVAPTTTTAKTTTTSASETTVESTTTTSTTEPPPTTSATTPPTDAPTTAAPPVTEAPTTTGELSAEDKVKADYQAARLARQQCTYDPYSCDYAAIAIPGSPMDTQTHDVVAKRIEQNVRGKPGFGDVDVTIESVGFEGDSAFVTICAYDTGVLFDIQDPSNPDDDIIQDDSKLSYRVRWELKKTSDGTWLLVEGTQLEELVDGNLCVA